MKRVLAIILIICLVFSGCNAFNTESGGEYTETDFENMSGKATAGVWLSFSEIAAMLSSQNGFEREIAAVTEECKKLGIDNIYVHVRSHCDAIYKSAYFPITATAAAYDYDVFKYMLDAFHSAGLKVHAWINPYRVSTASADVNAVRPDSPIHKWLTDTDTANDKNVCIYNGVYLNPAESEVQRLVIDGIRELVSNYSVDGIHFDDYFYPTTEAEFDKISYDEYKATAEKPQALDDWRRANVSSLIIGAKAAIKYINSDVVFSISPAASIENNYNSLYADVEYWVKNGLVDCVIPQLYFGFSYADSEFCFDRLLEDWKQLMNSGDCELIIGLASYKIGTQTDWDGTEWQTDDDIIARQVKMCYEDSRVSGYALFSYSSLVADNELNVKQRENLMKFREGI